MLSKSFLIGLALVERKLSVEEASKASLIETTSQTMKWGKIEDGKQKNLFAMNLNKHTIVLILYTILLAHDVENEYIKRQLGSVTCAIMVSK